MTRDIRTITSIEDGIDFFNEEIAGTIVTADGKTLVTTPIEK